MKNIKNGVFNVLLLIVFLSVCIIGAIQPYMEDDYGYYHQFHTETFLHVISGMYMNWSGRILNLFVMKYSTINKFFFYFSGVINGISFLATIFLIVTCALGRFPKIFFHDRIIFLLAFSAVWFGLPALGETVFWRSGAGGYLLPMLSGLILITPYWLWYKSEKLSFPDNILREILMILAGFITGISHEQVVFSLAFLLSAWLIYKKFIDKSGKKAPFYLYSGFISFLIGGLILLVAPGNYKRLATITFHQSLVEKLSKQIGDFAIYIICYGAENLWVWLAFILITAFMLNKNIRDVKKDFVLWFFTALVSILLVIILPLGGQRPMYFYTIFITIAFISLLNTREDEIRAFNERNVNVIITSVLSCILIVDCMLGIFSNYYLSKQISERKEMIESAKQKGISKIVVPPIAFRESHITYASDNPNRIFLEKSVEVDYSGENNDYRPKNIIDEMKVHLKDIFRKKP